MKMNVNYKVLICKKIIIYVYNYFFYIKVNKKLTIVSLILNV